MNIIQETVEKWRKADPENPPSPVPVPDFYVEQFRTAMETLEVLLSPGHKSLIDLADWEALQYRRMDRRRLAWMAIREEFEQLAGGNTRLLELFKMAEDAPAGGY